MLTPSSNTALEPLTSELVAPLGDAVSVHYARFRVTQIGLDAASDGQFQLEPILAAADLLADARPHVIAWNGTSASWLGAQTDIRLCDAVHARTGVATTSWMLAFEALCAARGVRRLGLVTPYTSDVQDRISANFAAAGLTVVAEAHCGLRDNFAFAEVPEDQVAGMCRAVSGARPDAVAIVCTNMRGARLVPALEAELDVPVFDSVAVTLWGALVASGGPASALVRFGGPFRESDATAPSVRQSPRGAGLDRRAPPTPA